MKLINGSQFEIVMDDELQRHFGNPYNYTEAIIGQFNEDIYAGIVTKADKIILDIGANVGLFALHVLPYAKKIICVEPTPEHMTAQRKIITQGLNSFKNCLVIHEEAAINSFTGKANFHRCGINFTMNSLHHQNREQSFAVNCITLADLLDKYNLNTVDFCKIDIEGGEDFAINKETLMACNGRIKKIFIELHPGNKEYQNKYKPIFESAGFEVKFNHDDALICTI